MTGKSKAVSTGGAVARRRLLGEGEGVGEGVGGSSSDCKPYVEKDLRSAVNNT